MAVYIANDINPNSIVSEVFNGRSLCSLLPTTGAAIYIFNDILELAINIPMIISELNIFRFEYLERKDRYLFSYDHSLAKRAKNLAINYGTEKESIKEASRKIIQLFTIYEIYELTLMQEWLKMQEVQNLLLRFLGAIRSNQIFPIHLYLIRDQELIAQAIYLINGHWVHD